jgi:hypothetical protein
MSKLVPGKSLIGYSGVAGKSSDSYLACRHRGNKGSGREYHRRGNKQDKLRFRRILMMALYNGIVNDRGVSESIGFLLIFSIVIVGIGLVTLYGYPLLLKQQVSADEKIMEKNMIVLQNDVKSLAFKTVPYKETSKIGSGSLQRG